MDTQEDSFKRGETPGGPGWGYDPNMGTLITKAGDGFQTRPLANFEGNYLRYYEGFRDAVANGAPNPVPAEDALEVINVIEIAMKSSAARAELPYHPFKL
jgi:predicted dehydrogenase